MSYTDCIKNLEMIESDIPDADDRYLRMRLAEVYGCIMCSDLTTEQCNHLVDELIRIGLQVGFKLDTVSDMFYTLEW